MAAVMAAVPFTANTAKNANIGFNSIEANAAFQPYNGKVVTKGSDLNVRSGPSTNYKVLYSVPNGTPVAILEEKNGWGKVSDANGGQWVSLNYIQRITAAEAIALSPTTTAKPASKPAATATVQTYPAKPNDGHPHGYHTHANIIIPIADNPQSYKSAYISRGDLLFITNDWRFFINPSAKTLKGTKGTLYRVKHIVGEMLIWYREKEIICDLCGGLVRKDNIFYDITWRFESLDLNDTYYFQKFTVN